MMRGAWVALVGLVAGCDLYYGAEEHPDAGTLVVDADHAGFKDAPPGSLPMFHYRFDDTLANDGTLGPTFDGTGTSYGFVAGKHGRAVAFDTTQFTSVVLPTQVPMSSGGAFTIGLWFREDVVWNSGDYTQYLFDNRGNGGFQTYHGYGGNQALTTCSGAGCRAFGYSVGTWHHLIYRHDGSAGAAPLEIFLDGVLVATLPASTVYFADTQKNITLGTRTNMQIDELKVYAAAFDASKQCALVTGGTWDNDRCALP
ncbi:MAG TPA: LamG-like jellyroll fold domain-containing protein [Kofleriaceae bacterium]